MANKNKLINNNPRFLKRTILLFCFFYLVFRPEPAHAYLDPGSGSFIIQIIIGALLGGLFTIRIFFARIKKFFTAIFSKENIKKDDKENNK